MVLACLLPWESGAEIPQELSVRARVQTGSTITGNLAEVRRRLFGKLFREDLMGKGNIPEGVVSVCQIPVGPGPGGPLLGAEARQK